MKLKRLLLSQKLILFLVVSMILLSCHPRSEEPSVLTLADSLMSARPDSALHLLESTSLLDMKTLGDSAKYALLITQARDKNYVKHTTDSLIRLAVDYYDSAGDILLKTKAHYYLGRIYQDMENEPLTIREYLIAMSTVEKTNDYELTCILQGNLGYLYFQQGLYDKADSLYQRAEQLAIMHCDTNRLATALSKRGDICMLRNEKSYTEAEQYLERALSLAKISKNESVEQIIVNSLSILYSYTGDSSKVISYSKRGISIQKDTAEHGSYYLLLGDAFYGKHQYDSAVVYLMKCLYSKRYYTRSMACMRLADIEKSRGNLDQALLWKDRYDAYKDSALHRECLGDIIASEKDTKMHLYARENKRFVQKYQNYIYLFCTVIVLLGIYFIYRRRKHQKIVCSLEDEKELLIQNASEQIEEKEAKLKRKESEIALLQMLIGECEGDRIRAHLLKSELEIQLEARQKLFRSIMLGSEIYKRLVEVINQNKRTIVTTEKIILDESDWVNFIAEVDRISGGFTSRLKNQYELLNEDDVRFCCLVKIGLNYPRIALVLNRTLNMMYKRRDSILAKMKSQNLKKLPLYEILEKL